LVQLFFRHVRADYFINHLPEDGIPLWDFELPPNEPRAKDSSAGAVAAAALLKLSRIYPGGPEKKRFHEAAMKIITSLNQDYFGRTEVPGVLSGGLFNKNMSLGIGGSTSWGDYYFIEALLLLQDTRS
jgi:unsaturated chondroitin disaccharide hydrolase